MFHNRTEVLKHFDSLLLKTYDEYKQKNKHKYDTKKKIVNSDKFTIPQLNEHDIMLTNNYNITQLKEIIRHYKLKLTGKKEILIARIFSYLYLSISCLKIQKLCHSFIRKKYIQSHGPAYLKRNLCVNDIDFLTMDDLKDIIPTQFFSYKDNNDFIYGFDIVSFHNLIKKSGSNVILNPFTKSQISSRVIHKFRQMVYLSQLLNITINLKIDEEFTNLAPRSSLNIAIELFQYIDQLGNYTNVDWFMNLTKYKLLDFILELFEIWNYRAELTNSVKIKICNPSGNPFYNESMLRNETIIDYLKSIPNIENVRLIILEIISKFVKNGINEEYQKIGAYYVLGALSLVSIETASSMPWLLDTFAY
jgi:hypothetical protein